MDPKFKASLRAALITARYQHRVSSESVYRVREYMVSEGLIEPEHPFNEISTSKNHTYCRLTEKGKLMLRQLRVEGNHFDNYRNPDPDPIQDKLFRLKHGIKY